MKFENSKIITYHNTIFKQKYRIDSEGNIWSPWRGWHLMSQAINKHGYQTVCLYTEEGRKNFRVHRLVMETFNPIENCIDLQVNHKDGNKSNNNIDNLEWCTRSENLKHAFGIGLEAKPKGEKNPSHKLTVSEVEEICKLLMTKKFTLEDIGKQYDVTKGCISHIKQKKTWKDVTEKYNFS